MGVNVPPPSQQRRLAEFATILGDYKLAILVWEALRKDGKGGAVSLPVQSSFIGHIIAYRTYCLSFFLPLRRFQLMSQMRCRSSMPNLLNFLPKHYCVASYMLLDGKVEFLRQSFWAIS